MLLNSGTANRKEFLKKKVFIGKIPKFAPDYSLFELTRIHFYMKLLFPKRFFTALGVLFVILLFSACGKSDKYIDWKVINQDWYNQHKHDPGFTVTESGLVYRRIGPNANPADRTPNANDMVIVNYTGKFIDGLEFDNGKKASFSMLGVVPGFQEALLKMRQGEIFEFYIPYEIGYGAKGSGIIPPYSTLIYRVELLESKAY